MSKIMGKNIYILRKDLRIHERYKDFIKKELLKLKKKISSKSFN